MAAWAPASAWPAFSRPSLSITIRLACPGGSVASASWMAWKMFVPRDGTSAFGRSRARRPPSGWSTAAASPKTMTSARSPPRMYFAASAAKR